MTRVKSVYLKFLSIFKNFFGSSNVYYITETADWVIKDIGKSISKSLDNELKFDISYSALCVKNSILHYGTEGVFFNSKKIKIPDKSNKVIVTWYHIKDDDKKLSKLLEADKYVDIWQTSCRITFEKLLKYGVDSSKVRLIPIGVDTILYKPLDLLSINSVKKDLEIPLNSIVIGSFQKDGNGWGDGLEPKPEKGPDIFCDVVEKLSKKYDIFVILTGPARGYVKVRLEKAGIKYRHFFLEDPIDVVKYYQISDIYIVASREEGGPKAILESMACGVPIVSTKVGMAPDVIEDGVDGFLSDIEDVDGIFEKCDDLISKKVDRDVIIKNAFSKVKKFDYKKLSDDYLKMYKELV